jgi:PAS domain S-box-containing protein
MQNHQHAENLAPAVELLPDILWIVESTSQISYSNRHWLDFAGISEQNPTSKLTFPPMSATHVSDYNLVLSLWKDALQTKQPFNAEVRLLKNDGNYVWHLMRACPNLKSGNWLVICTEIHSLKTVQSMFQLVLDNIPISIFWKDRDSKYLGCNQLFANDMGSKTTTALLGKSDYDTASSKEQCEFFIACDQKVMESGAAEYHIIEPQTRANGKQAWLDTSKIPLHDAGGKVVGLLGVYEDITERVTVDHQRDDFIATLTHDLKNPLLGTNRVLDLFLDGQLGQCDDNQQKIISQIKDSNDALIGMIENLLLVYKGESQALLMGSEKIDLCEMLERMIKRNEINAKQKESNLTLSKLTDQALIDGKNHSIERVVQNLLDNAFKFTGRNGNISVTLERVGDNYQITVADDGPGIKQEDQEKLFNRFWQGTPGKKYTHGTGLGLYLCKQIVEAHQGKITCQSEPANGTKFIVTLPQRSQSET